MSTEMSAPNETLHLIHSSVGKQVSEVSRKQKQSERLGQRSNESEMLEEGN